MYQNRQKGEGVETLLSMHFDYKNIVSSHYLLTKALRLIKRARKIKNNPYYSSGNQIVTFTIRRCATTVYKIYVFSNLNEQNKIPLHC